MKKRRTWHWRLLGCGGITLLCIFGGVLILILPGCPCPPKRDFSIQELLINEQDFPSGWKTNVIGPPASAPLGGQTSIERISVDFHNGQGVAVEEIHRYASIKAAAREFERVVSIMFSSGEHWSPWELPQGWHYQSPYADRIRIGCARETWERVSVEFCRMVGQYEEYIVRFSTKISPTYMTYTDFEGVVQAIDERMGYYLGKKTVLPVP